MRLLDRYILRHFVTAYVICFVSLLALYVVIDLFARIDEFTEHSQGVSGFFRNFGIYYGYRLPWFFQRLGGILALLAALSTLTWLEKQNEIVGWLAAGVPARRIMLPVLAGTLLVTGCSILNREFLVPCCQEQLQRSPDDPFGRKPTLVQGAYDLNMIHITGGSAQPERGTIRIGFVTLPPELAGSLIHLRCAEMVYRPQEGTDSSGWFLNGVQPETLECAHPALNWLGRGAYFLHTEIDFARLTRRADWFYYETTLGLVRLLETETQLQRRGEVIALLHRRLTAPLWDFVLVVIAVATALGRLDRNLYLKLGMNTVRSAGIQSLQLACMMLAQQQVLDPVLANWLPVLVFGPIAVALVDGMRT